MLKLITVLSLMLIVTVSCGDSDSNGESSSSGNTGGTGLTNETGQTCQTPEDCFTDVTAGEIVGESRCLDRVEGGYCTHLCEKSDDCCAVDGECAEGITQVCGPFESTGLMMCFISCENEQLGGLEADKYCQDFHANFICRSTGGGSDNKKVCVPGGAGTLCAVGDHCPVDFPHCCKDAFAINRCYDAAGSDGRTCLNAP
jgi:hypothetical protein